MYVSGLKLFIAFTQLVLSSTTYTLENLDISTIDVKKQFDFPYVIGLIGPNMSE